jgi:hypothetical protein
MTKYDVITVHVETKNGKNAHNVFSNDSNQTSKLVKSFDSLEEARKFYATIKSGVRKMQSYYLHFCKFIAENEYNEDGEIIGGGAWWDMEFPAEF